MDITLGNVLAALIPTTVIALVGYLLNRAVADVDRRVQVVEERQDEVVEKLDAVKDSVARDFAQAHKRISEVEADGKVTRTKVDDHIQWHMGER